MKFWQLILVLFISFIVGFSTNVFYENFKLKGPNEDQEKFTAFLDEYWEYVIDQNPTFASLLGYEGYDDKVSSNSISEFYKNRDFEKYVIDVLEKINPESLTEDDQLNYRLLLLSNETDLESRSYPGFYMRLNQRGGVQDYYDLASRLKLESIQDHRNWFERVKSYSQNVKNSLDINREGLEKGYTQPKHIVRKVAEQIDSMTSKKTEENPYFKSFSKLEAMNSDEAKELLAEVKEFIEDELMPSYKELSTFLKNEYIPNSRDSIGLSGVPDGKAWYEFKARSFTTTNLTPDEIHELGLKEIKRIRKEMEDVIKEVEWDGDFRSFLDFLRTDPQFYYETGEELLAAYRAMAKKIDAYMPTLFNKFPRAPYGVIEIPMETAPYTTTAYYNSPSAGRPGYFYANLYKPETRPKYEIPVLTVHEAVPGHHHQLSLTQELENVPNFRKYSGFTAFIEGWGLYSEQLGESMGIYDDPYDKFGQLTYDMWRAIRLVVDTGMHYKDWSRDDAINLFLENTAKTQLDIENEVDRYIAWPGQALAYKIGQLKIMELRDKAKESLGEDFDIKTFHDHILSFGSIPLNVLEEKVDEFIVENTK